MYLYYIMYTLGPLGMFQMLIPTKYIFYELYNYIYYIKKI